MPDAERCLACGKPKHEEECQIRVTPHDASIVDHVAGAADPEGWQRCSRCRFVILSEPGFLKWGIGETIRIAETVRGLRGMVAEPDPPLFPCSEPLRSAP